VAPLALAVNPLDLLLPQYNQMAKYFKVGRCTLNQVDP
jgi:phytoene desaturase (3,4-didehydrolycopene-forming)